MTSEDKLAHIVGSRDWRIWLGIFVTILWLCGGAWYVAIATRSAPVEGLPIDTVGGFLEGAFAPLAFLWLVIGLFIQQRELANNTRALQRTSEQSEKQTRAIAATEMNARQGTFFKIKENVHHQLGGITGMLFASSQGPAGGGPMSRDRMDQYFNQQAAGDSEVFARQFLTIDMMGSGGLRELFYGTELRQRHCENYIKTFQRLCRLAQNCDVDGIIEDALMQNAFGLLYRRMLEHKPASDNGENLPGG